MYVFEKKKRVNFTFVKMNKNRNTNSDTINKFRFFGILCLIILARCIILGFGIGITKNFPLE